MGVITPASHLCWYIVVGLIAQSLAILTEDEVKTIKGDLEKEVGRMTNTKKDAIVTTILNGINKEEKKSNNFRSREDEELYNLLVENTSHKQSKREGTEREKSYATKVLLDAVNKYVQENRRREERDQLIKVLKRNGKLIKEKDALVSANKKREAETENELLKVGRRGGTSDDQMALSLLGQLSKMDVRQMKLKAEKDIEREILSDERFSDEMKKKNTNAKRSSAISNTDSTETNSVESHTEIATVVQDENEKKNDKTPAANDVQKSDVVGTAKDQTAKVNDVTSDANASVPAIGDGDDSDDSHMDDDEKVDNMHSLPAPQEDLSACPFDGCRGSEEVLKKLRELNLFNEQQVECVKLLLEWRERFIKENTKIIRSKRVLTVRAMIMIAERLPLTPHDLNKVFGKLRPIARSHKADLLKCVTLAIQRHPNIKPTTSGLMQHEKEFKSFDEQQAIGDGDDGDDSHMNNNEKDDNMRSLTASQKDFSASIFECAKLLVNSPEQTVAEVLQKYRKLHLFNELQVECVKLLVEWREGVSKKTKIELSQVMGAQTIIRIANGLPETKDDWRWCTKEGLSPIARKSKADIHKCVTLAIQRHPNINPSSIQKKRRKAMHRSFHRR